MDTMGGVVQKHKKNAYVGMQNSLNHEDIFFVTCHPGHRDGIIARGGRAAKGVPPGPL